MFRLRLPFWLVRLRLLARADRLAMGPIGKLGRRPFGQLPNSSAVSTTSSPSAKAASIPSEPWERPASSRTIEGETGKWVFA
jgi:hypothetical protein